MGKNDALVWAGLVGGAIFLFRNDISATFGAQREIIQDAGAGVATGAQGLGQGIATGAQGAGLGFATGAQGLGAGVSDVALGVGNAARGIGDNVQVVGDSVGSNVDRSLTGATDTGLKAQELVQSYLDIPTQINKKVSGFIANTGASNTKSLKKTTIPTSSADIKKFQDIGGFTNLLTSGLIEKDAIINPLKTKSIFDGVSTGQEKKSSLKTPVVKKSSSSGSSSTSRKPTPVTVRGTTKAVFNSTKEQDAKINARYGR